MKKLLSFLTFTLILTAFNAYPIQITQHMTGSWYNPEQDGHGFNIEVIGPNKSVFYWYVYNPDGTPTWLVGRGPHVDGRIEGIAYHNTGMRWGVFDPLERTQERWGTVTIDFIDCNNATVNYQSDDLSEQTIPYGFGDIHITRLTYIHKSKCSAVPYAGIYKGTLWSETREEGFPATVLLDAESGYFVAFAMDYKTFWGEATVNGKDFGGLGSVFANDTGDVHYQPFSMQGRIVEDYRLFMEFVIPDADYGFADVYPVPQQYFRDATLAGLAGNYEVEDLQTFNEGTATIDANGAVTGTTAAGCNWSGSISIANTEFNMFDISLTVTECGESNGFYQGKGYQDDAEDLEDNLSAWFFSFNELRSFSAFMTRTP